MWPLRGPLRCNFTKYIAPGHSTESFTGASTPIAMRAPTSALAHACFAALLAAAPGSASGSTAAFFLLAVCEDPSDRIAA